MPSSKNVPGSARRLMRSRAVNRPLACWLSMAFGPPPSRIFSSSLRTCETRSAIKRMLASKRAEVGSTLEGNRLDVAVDWETSLRSAMRSQMQTNYGIPAEQAGANEASSGPCLRTVAETVRLKVSRELGGE